MTKIIVEVEDSKTGRALELIHNTLTENYIWHDMGAMKEE